ncbi:MAG: TonB-dependent receptor [Bacteroidales bacterium]|nr:TonB-dependent receptor [Bacteroidales bacterium]
MNKRLHRQYLWCTAGIKWCALGVALLLGIKANGQDTVRLLDEVEISTQRTPSTLHTAAPTQVISAEQIAEQGAMQVSDAVRLMAGLTLKDYGGIGGMKTVSARGLGSQFSTLVIDGVAVNDAQNGQVDLGRYLVGNAAYVSFSQGQQQQALLPARVYAAGNVVEVASAEPRFFLAERTNLRLGMELGSFGMMNPTALWEQKWSKRLKSSLWGSWLKSDGDYPFTLYYTASRSDSSSRERRHHSATEMLTTDGVLFYTPDASQRLTVKLHYMRGTHQLPGPVHLYRQQPSAENTSEEVAFGQVRWRKEGERWKVQTIGKLQSSYDKYEDSAANTISRYLCNDYRQREAYASGSMLWQPLGWLDVSASTDGSIGWLHSNLGQHNQVRRESLLGVAAIAVHWKHIEAKANVLYTAVADRVADMDAPPSYQRLSPYAGLTYSLGSGRTTLRYFVKETYRVPNFSELYYLTLLRELRPERALQHNIGFTHAGQYVSTTLDAYYNRVSDKILAIPTQNMFLWSMQNLGQAEIAGIDATISAAIDLGSTRLEAQGNYTYQHAVDRTDAAGKTYGHQIAYIPRHTGSGSLRWETQVVNLGVTMLVEGDRYYMMQNSSEALMPAYCDIGISADRKIDLRWGVMVLQVQALNVADCQYEVVKAYPMMGRNYRLKILYQF